MPIADTKKCQTLINLVANAVDDLRAQITALEAIATRLERVRQLYTEQAVNPAGTPLDGKIAQVSTWINSVRAVIAQVQTVADSPVATAFLANYVPGHRNMAFGEVI